MNMSIISLILIAILCVNGDRMRAARYYRQQHQRQKGQMGFKWTRSYAQGPSGGGFGSGYSSNTDKPQYGYGSYASTGGKGNGYGTSYVPPSTTGQPEEFDTTENDATTTTTSTTESFIETTEETVAAEPTVTIEGDNEEEEEESTTSEPAIVLTPEGEEIGDVELVQNSNDDNKTDEHQPPIMDCLYKKCAESFNACFNDDQCKKWMEEWQKEQSLKPECLPNYQSSTPEIPQTTQLPEEGIKEDVTFETTSDINVEPTANTEYNANTENTEGTVSATGNTEYNANTETTEFIENNENTETTQSPEEEEKEGGVSTTECPYNELFWNLYQCGYAVDNFCYADQLKLEQSHQYLLSPSNYRVPANVAGSTKSSHSAFDFKLLWVAITSGIAAIILFEVSRRLYKGIKQKCQCGCGCVSCCNSLRYLRNKLDQIRGYHRYEKTHENLDAIEEEEDAEKYGSNKEESITKDTDTIGVTYNGPLNDSDISDDEELQKSSSSRAMSLDAQTDEEENNNNDGIDDQFVHSDIGHHDNNNPENETDLTVKNDELVINKDENNGNVLNNEQKDKEEETIVEEPVQPL